VPEPERRAGVCAIARDEGVYLHEWIAYHRVIGFDEVVVYDHESTDGTSALLDELAEQGLVTRVPWSVADDVSPQRSAYLDAMERFRGRVEWMGFFDVDEFLVLVRHETVGDFLDEYADRDAIAVNWRLLGSGGQERYRPEPVIDRFRRGSGRRAGRNRRVKALARLEALRGPPSPHTPLLHPPARYLTVSGEPAGSGRASVDHDTIRLNHYYTKSYEEWQWKLTRGRGGKPSNRPEAKYGYPSFAVRDVDEEEEVDIVRRLPALRELMAATRPRTVPDRPPSDPDRSHRMRAEPGDDGRYRPGIGATTLRMIHEDVERHLPSLRVGSNLEVGANVGGAVADLRRLWPEAEIHAFEPVAAAHAELAAAAEGLEGVTAHRLALGAADGEGHVTAAGTSEANRMAPGGRAKGPVEAVRVARGDTFCAEHGLDAVDYVRIDAEGAELEVVAGLMGLLSRHRVALLEVVAGMSWEDSRHVPFERLKGALEPLGYHLLGLYEQRGDRRRPRLQRVNAVFIATPVMEADARGRRA
jgi:FkbM family methyltransferase